ncbi:MAG: hypothetical protein N3B01_10280 [Verrucomicrobiae bacterium]|nr:hypothetical protein [Verrucomicrobiae bacterium]
MKCRMLVTAIALALVGSLTAFAAGEKKGKGPGLLPPPIVEKLSADQKAKYDELLKEAKGADPDKIKELRKKAVELLTDDQKAEYKKIMAEAKAKAGGKGKK